MLNNKNKSQISMFIVISIILVIVGIFMFTTSSFDFLTSKSSKLKTSIIESVDQCILREADNGVFLLGFQGGHIKIPKELSLDPINYKHKYIDLGFKILNWDVGDKNIPTLNSMKLELEDYIKNNSKSCIDANLNSLKDRLNITIKGDLQINVTLNNDNVLVNTFYPIKFNEINSKQLFLIEDYFVKLEGIRLKGLFELSKEIYNLESNSNFLEELTLEQIYSANDYSSKESMPSEGMNIKCGFVPWTIPQLEKNLANLNNKNFKYLQFVGTYSKNSIFSANLDTNFQKYYRSPIVGYVQNLQNVKPYFKDFDVGITMPSIEQTGKKGFFQRYPYRKFEVKPSSGQIVKPMNLKISNSKIPIPCIQVYHHLYSLDYDLLIKIVDKNIDGKNYFFQFPIRVKIEDNQAKKKANPVILSEVPTATNDVYCADNFKKYPLKIFAIDKSNDNLLSGVNISYQCINLRCDNIGSTKKRLLDLGDGRDVIDQRSRPSLETNFPYCYGGKIIAKKEGYFNGIVRGIKTDSSLLLDTSSNNAGIVQVPMIPTIDFKLSVSSFLLKNKDNGQSFRIRNLKDGNIYINIENKGLEFDSQALYPIEEPGFLDKVSFLKDDSITYNVTVIYMDADYNFRGILELNNYKPDLSKISSSSKISFNIPTLSTKIDDTSFMDFYNYMQMGVGSNIFGIEFN